MEEFYKQYFLIGLFIAGLADAVLSVSLVIWAKNKWKAFNEDNKS